MLKLLYRVSTAALLLLFASAGLSAQANGQKNPYSMEVRALKGETATDVYLSFSTSDPALYPVPQSLKMLQMKMRNTAGDIVFMENVKDAALTGDLYTAAVAGVNQHNELEVQASIESPFLKKGLVLKGSAVCKLKPDLSVSGVFAPTEVKINELFNVEAVINEVNLETGSVCDVALYAGDVLFAVVPGVEVPANGHVSVVFQGVTHSAAEVKSFTIKINNSNPGEYSTTNNELSFDVNFIDPVLIQGMSYSFLYNVQKNYHYINSYVAENGSYSSIKTQENPHYEMFSFAGYSYPDLLPSGKILNCSITVQTEKGVFMHFDVTDPVLTYEDSYYKKYDIPVPNSLMHIYVTENHSPYSGTIDYEIYQYGSNRVYIYTLNGEIISQQTEQVPEEYFIDASEFINASIKIAYENTTFYTEGSLIVTPLKNYSYSSKDTYFDYSLGTNIVRTLERFYQSSYSSASGSYIPSSGEAGKLIAGNPIELKGTGEKIPSAYALEQNYPNPFNPSTTIRFALPKAANVLLKVYDAAGRDAAVLVNGYMEAGYKSVDFNASGLSSGLYLYRLQAGEFVRTGKMMLMK